VKLPRLPPYHVGRPRLTDQCDDESIVVVEAGAGYGKSVLAAELVHVWGAVPIELVLEEGGVSAHLLVGRLRAAVARAGFSAAATEMSVMGDDPAGALDAVLEALSREACAIVIDDAHNATRDAAVLIDRLAAAIAPPQRLVVLARALPAGAHRLRRANALLLSADDLALRPDEALELCRSGFGLDVSVEDARLLTAATAGWTAAAVLAASRAMRTDTSLRDLTAGHVGGGSARVTDPMETILQEVLVTLRSHEHALSQLARLPWLDRALMTEFSGDADFMDRVCASGLPLTPSGEGWWTLPGPVRDRLAALAAPDPALLEGAAAHLCARGELGAALQVLLAADLIPAAARLLADSDGRHLEAVDTLELVAVLAAIPEGVLDRFPRSLLNLASAFGAAGLREEQAGFTRRGLAVVDPETDPQLHRALEAQAALALCNEFDRRPAEALARRVLEQAGADEQLTRAHATAALGMALAWRREPDGRLRPETLEQAGVHMRRANDIYLALGYGAFSAGLGPHRAIRVELALGRPEVAVEVLSDGLARVLDRPRRFIRNLFWRAQALTELGRYQECEQDLQEIERVATALEDAQMLAYVPWQRMVACSQQGAGDATLAHARAAEQRRSAFSAYASAHFCAEAADCLDRVGLTALAWDYLDRAQRDPQDAERLIAMAECALEARHGNPVRAQALLEHVHRHGIAPREYWRLTLLRAAAAWRRGASAEAGALAARAFEEAAALGQAQLPLVRERELSESLIALAARTGLPAAVALEETTLPLTLTTLGRFELARGGRPVELPGRQPTMLLKLVAIGGGKLNADQAIELLWPDTTPASGRNRLRTVLNRVKDAAPDVIVREGDVLRLGTGVRLDLERFMREAMQSIALAPVQANAAEAIARSAIACYQGELLPTDLYAEWAFEMREKARRTVLDLFDLCTDAALDRGDLDEARRLVERTVEIAPDEHERYLRAAAILREQGRTGAALSTLARARAALDKLGLGPSPQLVTMERTLAA
jgi:DNA-binding SARP family transcriptional activator